MSAANSMNIDGKVIVITGAARGIGQEYARYLGGLGARIVIADISDCSGTLDLVKTGRGTAVGVKLDVASAASAMDLARTALDAFGRVDALINNAALYGSLKGGRFDAISEADWDAAMAVNVRASGTAARPSSALRQAAAAASSISPLAATYGMPYGLHYTTSKAAVIGLTAARARARARQYPCECRGPSAVLTEGTREFFAEKAEKAPRRHQGEPGDRAQSRAVGPGRHRAVARVRREPAGHGTNDRGRRRNGDALSGCGPHACPVSRGLLNIPYSADLMRRRAGMRAIVEGGRRWTWDEGRALVTGASKGIGLAVARALRPKAATSTLPPRALLSSRRAMRCQPRPISTSASTA
jgi:3-oxoacyl-[acyl-carrier protein] reductase